MATQERSHISENISRRRIHILSVIDDLYFGGDEYRLHAFGSSLDKTRFDHTVLTLMKEDRALGEQYGSMRDLYRESGIRLLDLGQMPISPAGRRRNATLTQLLAVKDKVQRLAALIRDEKVDVLDVHLSPANPICALAALKTRTPFAVTLYQINERRSAKIWLSGQFSLGRAALLITDSEAQAAKMRQWLVYSPGVCVIPNGTLPPQATVPRDQMLKLFDIPDRRALTIIGQVSSLISYKGQLVLIEAAKRVLDRNPNCFFLLVGYERRERGYKESLLQRASALGIDEQVRVVSYPGPIGDAWNIIDIHVHASLLDSLPNALLEAMSLGKPSVLSAVGGIPEVIKHGLNGLLVPPGNPAELAHCLLMLLGDSRLRETIGKEAQSSYSRSFSPNTMTRRLESVFSNLVTRSEFPALT